MTERLKKTTHAAVIGAVIYFGWLLLVEIATASNTLQPFPLHVPSLLLRLALAPLLGGAAGAAYAYVTASLGRDGRARAVAGAAAGAAFAGVALAIGLIRGGITAPPLVAAGALVSLVLVGSLLAWVIGWASPRRHVAKRLL